MNAVEFDLYTLIPNFKMAGFSTSSHAITANFVIVMAIISAIGAIYALKRFIESRSKIIFYTNLVNGIEREDLAAKREDILQKAKKHGNGNLWQEFDESLVYSSDGTKLSNTLDADHFFNERTLARSLTGNRLLAAVPAFLTALGVLGTFAGLQLGLASLELTSESDVNVLKSGIFSMMSGASTAFVTSVWGVLLSLIFNLYEKSLERIIRKNIAVLQDLIDFLYPRITTEQTLIRISDSSNITSRTMQTLAEQIGDRLQQSLMQASESIRIGMNENLNAVQQSMAALSDNMREGLEKGMYEILKPAVDSISQSAQTSGGQMVETLVSQFLGGVDKAGAVQQQAMENAADKVQSAVESMGTQMNVIMQALEAHGRAAQESSQQAISNITQAMQDSQSVFDERSKALNDEFKQQISAVSQASSNSVEEMKSLLTQIIDKNSEQQLSSEARFNQVVHTIESMLQTVSDKSQEIDDQRFQAMERQLSQISSVMHANISGFEQVVSNISEAQAQRDTSRQEEFSNSVLEMRQSQESLLEKLKELSSSFSMVSDKIHALAASHEHLSKNVLGAADNLNTASVSLGTLGLNINNAAGKIENGATLLDNSARETSGVIKDSTLLAKEYSTNLQKSLATIDHIEKQISDTAKTMGAAVNASREGFDKIKADLELFASELLKTSAQHASSLDTYLEHIEKRTLKLFQELANELRTHQNTITEDVQDKYTDFSKDVEQLMQNFGQQTQTQINTRLNEWNAQTSQYTKTMTDAIKALANVVGDIEDKVGKA
ncbi:anti-phage defense ZorAB system protein ZorA [Desulfomicrobium sp. ZS1]|uniref:anti-phage ZorAB system protein ZorA n=1 Tax=Desulfomicrobium sp. ZS1 TaxID=2952228 RepID=UPI0020B1BCB2|nr:anti-phage ZorAB system protein ZorA [Desulfomicrobium sp. ZS1]UTF51783.1 anti-phage defense ZorAB system protein ZorA [Desulfomicrobium sp. ZS1]